MGEGGAEGVDDKGVGETTTDGLEGSFVGETIGSDSLQPTNNTNTIGKSNPSFLVIIEVICLVLFVLGLCISNKLLKCHLLTLFCILPVTSDHFREAHSQLDYSHYQLLTKSDPSVPHLRVAKFAAYEFLTELSQSSWNYPENYP